MQRIALLLLLLIVPAMAQNTTNCESYKDGDDSITVCTSGEYKSVTRCNRDASSCTHSTAKVSEESTENLRKFCMAGIEADCEKFADRFVSREGIRKDTGDLCEGEYGRTHTEDCKHAAEQSKLDQEIVDKYLERVEAKRAAKTIELCDKHVFDAAYCEAFKKKLRSKVHTPESSSEPNPPTSH